jgi:hypothetical protein
MTVLLVHLVVIAYDRVMAHVQKQHQIVLVVSWTTQKNDSVAVQLLPGKRAVTTFSEALCRHPIPSLAVSCSDICCDFSHLYGRQFVQEVERNDVVFVVLGSRAFVGRISELNLLKVAHAGVST